MIGIRLMSVLGWIWVESLICDSDKRLLIRCVMCVVWLCMMLRNCLCVLGLFLV